MELELFIKRFEEQFDDIEPGTVHSETIFKDLEGWDSMTALSLIAMVDEEYSVKLTGDEIKRSGTVHDIYNVISSKV